VAASGCRPGKPTTIDVGYDAVTGPNALSMPLNITAAQVRGFARAVGRTVLGGGVGRMLETARSNLRNVPRS
jgi:pyruvate dehydrogenase (quinone)